LGQSPPVVCSDTVKIEGLDCIEEAATLKSKIGPIAGGCDKLTFDVLNGRMTLLLDVEPVTEKTIIKAVAAQCFGFLLNLRPMSRAGTPR